MNSKTTSSEPVQDKPDKPTPPTPPNNPGAPIPQVRIDTTTPQLTDAPGNEAKLPHERDESVDMTKKTPHPEIQQAHRDLKKGLVNTDARAADGRPLGDDVPSP